MFAGASVCWAHLCINFNVH